MHSTKYSQHSIGEHLVPYRLVFHKDSKVSEVTSKVRHDPTTWPNSEDIIVVDSDNKLIGVVELKKILASPGKITLANLVSENYPYVTEQAHQSNVAKIALRHGTENIPVVDEDNHFVGIIDATQILKILHEEHVEKLMHFSGILNNESLLEGYKARIAHVVRSRLPWLLLGLAGGAFSTFLIRSYSKALETELSLAFFIPVIVYMNAAVGTQAQTIFVRYSSFEKIHLLKSLIFELKVSAIVALTLASIIFVFTGILIDFNIGVIVALSMFFGILSSAVIGTIIPWFLEKQGKDPAIGSGPFTTIIQDLLSIIIYFNVASMLL